MSAFNLKTAWTEIINRVYTERNYDASFTLRSPESIASLEATLRHTPAVRDFEIWQSEPVAFHTPGQTPVVSTYPDGGHGTFTLYGVPPDTNMITFPLRTGRWLRAGDTDSVVLNHAAHAARPNLAVGGRVSLSVDGHPREWTIVGFIDEVGSAATAYVPRAEMIVDASNEPKANLLRITTTAHTPEEKLQAIHDIEQALESHGLIVKLSLSLKELKTAMGAHITVLIKSLIAAALVMGTVAGLGLSAMLSMSVLERTREFGVLRAVGATPAVITRMILSEAAVMGIFGLLAAIPLSLAVSALLGQIVGTAAFQIPLPFSFSHGGFAVCFATLALVIVGAAGLPARAASQITVRDALDFR
jgi:putative ABC transport system permease protein